MVSFDNYYEQNRPYTDLDEELFCSSKPDLSFPLKLYCMLEDSTVNGTEWIVSWLPCGRSFKVHARDEFMSRIAPLYFNQSKYKSFQRQLLLYGFEKKNSLQLVEKNSYSHPSFVRGHREAVAAIRRASSANESKRPKAFAVAAATSNQEQSQHRRQQNQDRKPQEVLSSTPTVTSDVKFPAVHTRPPSFPLHQQRHSFLAVDPSAALVLQENATDGASAVTRPNKHVDQRQNCLSSVSHGMPHASPLLSSSSRLESSLNAGFGPTDNASVPLTAAMTRTQSAPTLRQTEALAPLSREPCEDWLAKFERVFDAKYGHMYPDVPALPDVPPDTGSDSVLDPNQQDFDAPTGPVT